MLATDCDDNQERKLRINLSRFISAQADSYPRALAELQAGHKTSHWMWYIFPQLAALGRSDTAKYYGIADRAEAVAYLAEPLLAARLAEVTAAMLGWSGRRSSEAILGPVDAAKFRSSMTLFEAAGGEACFGEALDAFYTGERDPATLALLG